MSDALVPHISVRSLRHDGVFEMEIAMALAFGIAKPSVR
jgi:hypothetical protein